jgi:prepilin-type N-terminal cleavage/methylation domain-containing protein
MTHSHRNPKGFTLIEMLLVFLLLGILGTMAATSYFNSSKDFKFLENYKYLTASIREARSNALTNKETSGVVPSAYGLYLDGTSLIMFADDGDYLYEVSDTEIKAFNFTDTNYEIQVYDPGYNLLALPMTLFYETGGLGDLTIMGADGSSYYSGMESDEKSTVIRFSDSGRDLEKHVVILNFSGIPEEVFKYPSVSPNQQNVAVMFSMVSSLVVDDIDSLERAGAAVNLVEMRDHDEPPLEAEDPPDHDEPPLEAEDPPGDNAPIFPVEDPPGDNAPIFPVEDPLGDNAPIFPVDFEFEGDDFVMGGVEL